MGHHARARVIEMLAHRAIQLVEFPFIGQPQPEDHRAHAAHQVRADGAAGVAGPVDARSRLDPDVVQARLVIQLGQAAADEQIGAVPAERGVEDLAQPGPGGVGGVAQ